MHQLILTKSGVPHPYVDPAPEEVGGQLTPWTSWLSGPWKDYEMILTVKWQLHIPYGDNLALSFRHL